MRGASLPALPLARGHFAQGRNGGRTSDEFLAFYIDSFWLSLPEVSSLDSFTLSNHDFFIANRAFNPNLNRRAPHALHYARTRQAENEWFIAGHSGAGYLNPGSLFAGNRPPGRPDGWKEWIAYCRDYDDRYDLTLTGFIIDGASPACTTTRRKTRTRQPKKGSN